MSDSLQQTVHGCGTASKIHYTIYGILALSILPFAIWTFYQHFKMYHSNNSLANKLLYKLSIAVYLCTVIGTFFTVTTSFGACIILPTIWWQLWFMQNLFWLTQWFLFIVLLFSRYLILCIPIFPYMTQPFRCLTLWQGENCISWICVSAINMHHLFLLDSIFRSGYFHLNGTCRINFCNSNLIWYWMDSGINSNHYICYILSSFIHFKIESDQ